MSNQSHLITVYVAALQRNPAADPPAGLDTATARAIRAAVLAGQIAPPDAAAKTRIWQNALHAAQTPPAVSHLPFSSNGTKDNHLMTTQALPRTRRLTLNYVTLAAALIGVLLFIIFMVPNPLRHPAANSPAAVYLSSPADNQAVFERYINEAWNTGDMTVLGDVLTETHILHQPGAPAATGIDSVAALISGYRTAFSDWQFAIEALTVTDDTIWARLTGTGTHDGPQEAYPGAAVIEATGNPITLDVMLNVRFADGKIAEQWLQSDSLGLLLQMEAIPPVLQTITETANMATIRRVLTPYYVDQDRSQIEQVYHPMVFWHYGDRHFAQDWYWNDPDAKVAPDLIIDGFDYRLMSIDALTAAGDFVIAKTTFTGQFVRPIPAPWADEMIEPTNEQVTWSWMFTWRFVDGKVAEEWWVWDWPLADSE